MLLDQDLVVGVLDVVCQLRVHSENHRALVWHRRYRRVFVRHLLHNEGDMVVAHRAKVPIKLLVVAVETDHVSKLQERVFTHLPI